MPHTYLYTDQLRVDGVVFAFGPIGGGQAVAVLGAGFVAGASVKFGGAGATGVTVANSSTIYCTTPAHASGFVSVQVTNPDATIGTLVDGYLYQSATGRFVTTGLGPIRRQPSIQVQDTLGQPQVCTFTAETEPSGLASAQIVVNGVSIFLGTVQDKIKHVDGDSHNVVWDVTLLDYTTKLNSRRPFGVYDDVSVSTIVSGAMAAYAPEFTVHVEASLPHTCITIDGTQDFSSLLNTLAERAGGAHWYVDGLDLWFFVNDPSNNNPATVTDATVLRAPNQDPRIELDYRSIRNRVYVFGAGGIVVQVDDTDSQALYGVQEFTVTDTNLTTSALLTARGNVELKNFALPVPTAHYSIKDATGYTRSGKFVVLAIVHPPISGTYLIQEVTKDQINEQANEAPRYTVIASPVRFNFIDLISGAVLSTQEPRPPGLGGDIQALPGGPIQIPPASIPADRLAGCIPSSALLPTGVTPGTYGSGANVTVVTVNAEGQATAASSVPIAIAESQVANLVADLALIKSRPVLFPEDSGEPPFVVPGQQGAAGAAGPTGPAGPMGPVLFVEDGQPGMDGMTMPSSGGSGSGIGSAWSVLTNGDGTSPALVFDSFGDVIMTETLR